MTSIMHPGTYARVNAVQAKQSLQEAASVLRHDGPMPFDGAKVGIPEHNGPDSPDNPWFIKPQHGGSAGFPNPYQIATQHANDAMDKLTTALGVQSELSTGAVTALNQARREALAGVHALTDTAGLHDGRGIALTFDASSMWIDLAVNLIDLDMKGGRPPVTILPVPGPGEPGSPITIKPIDTTVPVTTMPVEVEAPEAMVR